ncbi:hypothetical protein RND81_11G020000 [Saponaria officinalis]|uniref:Uncharacterized protein n=1 Tax=Saponaria officinalis TaxID=3572 RepID=A0AAW1HGU3_SAPOF
MKDRGKIYRDIWLQLSILALVFLALNNNLFIVPSSAFFSWNLMNLQVSKRSWISYGVQCGKRHPTKKYDLECKIIQCVLGSMITVEDLDEVRELWSKHCKKNFSTG